MGRKKKGEPTIVSELITILEQLKNEGIDVENIKQTKKSAPEKKDIRLKDICEPHILKKYKLNGHQIIKSIISDKDYTILSDEVPQDIIKKLNLDESYPIGLRISCTKDIYKGTRKR